MPFKQPSPPWYGTMFLQHNNGLGWSESFWLLGPSQDEANNQMAGLVNARRELFDSQCKVVIARISDASLKGDTFVSPYFNTRKGKYGQGADPDFLTDMMPPQVAFRLRMQYEDRWQATRMLRCLPEEVMTDGEKVVVAAWVAKFELFKTALMTNTVGLFKNIRTAPVPAAPIQKGLLGVTIMKTSTRKTGRPFGLSPARSVTR